MLVPILKKTFALIFLCSYFDRPTPQRLGGMVSEQHQGPTVASTLESDQLYPEEYSYQGGGYFNPLQQGSPSSFRTLPRGMYQAVNPLKEYGYPSDYGLPMASLASTTNSCYITSNPLSELEEEELREEAMNRGMPAAPQVPLKQNHGHLSAAGPPLGRIDSPPTLINSSTPTPTGSSSSACNGNNSLYAKVNKKSSRINQSKRESPDEGIQDDVSTDV